MYSQGRIGNRFILHSRHAAASAVEADHGRAAAAVVRVHAKLHDSGGLWRRVLDTERLLAARAADDVEQGVRGQAGGLGRGRGRCLGLQGDGRRAHCEGKYVEG